MSKHALYNSGNRDDNEAQILELLNMRNIRWTQFRPGDGADLLIWIQPMELWEIKNPEQPASKQTLTDSEKDALEYCIQTRIPYYVIKTVDEALERINEYFNDSARI